MSTYYVDSKSGCDCRSGLSPREAWASLKKVSETQFAPGDRILFRSGCVFEGQLWPKGSGSAEAPITVGRFASGPKPVIDGKGSHGTAEGNYLDGAAVVLFNQNHWVISDLDITNQNPFYRQTFTYFTPDGRRDTQDGSPKNRYRYGVLVRWDSFGLGEDVTLRNLDIHDVYGESQRFTSDGILVACTGAEGSREGEDGNTVGGVPTRFDGVLIEDCTIRNIERTGISVFSQWMDHGGTTWKGSLQNTGNFYHRTVGEWQGSTGLVIRGCRMSWMSGDAILIGATKGAIIEDNYVEHACYEQRIGPNAAVWPINADGTVMRRNEICFTHGVKDGQAFDIDLTCYDTVIEDNFTHDNEGGFLLVMGDTYRSIARRNISQNDRGGISWIHQSGEIRFEDNIFYLGTEDVKVFRSPYRNEEGTLAFEGNTFVFPEPTEVNWDNGGSYKGNRYFNCNPAAEGEEVLENLDFWVNPSPIRLDTRPEDYEVR